MKNNGLKLILELINSSYGAYTVDTLLLAHLPFYLDGEAIQRKENKNEWANEWLSTNVSLYF